MEDLQAAAASLLSITMVDHYLTLLWLPWNPW